jgi:hypothetical protein
MGFLSFFLPSLFCFFASFYTNLSFFLHSFSLLFYPFSPYLDPFYHFLLFLSINYLGFWHMQVSVIINLIDEQKLKELSNMQAFVG